MRLNEVDDLLGTIQEGSAGVAEMRARQAAMSLEVTRGGGGGPAGHQTGGPRGDSPDTGTKAKSLEDTRGGGGCVQRGGGVKGFRLDRGAR